MWPRTAAILLGTGGVAVAGYAGYQRRRRAKAAAARALAAAQPAAPELTEPPTEASAPLNLPGALRGLLQGGNVGTIAAGLGASELGARLVEKLGAGEGKGNLVRVGGIGLTLPVLADVGAKELLDLVGIEDAEAQKTAGQLAAAAVSGAFIPVLGVKLLDAGLGLISEDAQEAVHDALRPFDPTNPNSAAGKVVGVVAGGVKEGVTGVVKGVQNLLGVDGPTAEELAEREVAAREAQMLLETGAVSTTDLLELAEGGISLGNVRAVADTLQRAQGASLTVLGTTFLPGAGVLVRWASASGHSPKDWVGLYKVGAPNSPSLAWAYVPEGSSGTLELNAPPSGGPYEARYLLNDGYEVAAHSNTFYVATAEDAVAAARAAVQQGLAGLLSLARAPAPFVSTPAVVAVEMEEEALDLAPASKVQLAETQQAQVYKF